MKNVIINGVEYTPVINKDNEGLTKTFGFEIYPKDLGQMTWHDAVNACEALGEGWRLPTRMELVLIYENRDIITFLAANYYWSSSEYSYANARVQDFSNGIQYYSYEVKYTVRAVRPVKTIK